MSRQCNLARGGGLARRAPLGAVLAAVLLLAGLPPLARAQDPCPSPTGVNATRTDIMCPSLSQFSAFCGRDYACIFVDSIMKLILGAPPAMCLNPSATGTGDQVQPITKPSTKLPPKAQKKAVPIPIPNRGNPPFFEGKKLTKVLETEAPTYLWHFDVIRNIRRYFPCSKPFNGSQTAYLVPTGWEAVGGTTGYPGLYPLVQGGVPYPMMAVIKQASSRHMVFALRTASTPIDWQTNLSYQRIAYTFKGDAFTGNSFDGTVHAGYASAFEQLWPSVQALLKAQILDAPDRKSAPKFLTFSGHTIGGDVAQLLAFASKRYLKANNKGSTKIGVVTFGSPALGDTAFVNALSKLVEVRRVVFEHDLYSLLPCNSSATATQTTAMPACPKAIVPTGNPSGLEYWPDYQQAYGGVFFKASDMPVQKEAWDALKVINLRDPLTLYRNAYSADVCSYTCYLRQYVEAPDSNNLCLLSGSQEGYSLCNGIGS